MVISEGSLYSALTTEAGVPHDGVPGLQSSSIPFSGISVAPGLISATKSLQSRHRVRTSLWLAAYLVYPSPSSSKHLPLSPNKPIYTPLIVSISDFKAGDVPPCIPFCPIISMIIWTALVGSEFNDRDSSLIKVLRAEMSIPLHGCNIGHTAVRIGLYIARP